MFDDLIIECLKCGCEFTRLVFFQGQIVECPECKAKYKSVRDGVNFKLEVFSGVD